MTRPVATASSPAVAGDCWNRIGVRGDASCPELKRHVHCRNCPVYSAAAADLLDVEPPPGYLEEWTGQLAHEKSKVEPDARSILIFRVAAEWLALPAAALLEIAGARPIHPIPHRRDGVLLGLANVRGVLQICISLQRILGLEAAAEPSAQKQGMIGGRLLVIQRETSRAVCPVDEVHGIERFTPRQLAPVPVTVAKAAATYSQAVLSWRDHSVGLLDDELLFHTINRSLA
jgi:chemotaxis-related protein WspD